MKIYLIDQECKMTNHLRRLKKEQVMVFDLALLKEKITTVELKTKKNIDEVNLDFLFAYDIFPQKHNDF